MYLGRTVLLGKIISDIKKLSKQLDFVIKLDARVSPPSPPQRRTPHQPGWAKNVCLPASNICHINTINQRKTIQTRWPIMYVYYFLKNIHTLL